MESLVEELKILVQEPELSAPVNKQLYPNSDFAGSAIEEMVTKSSDSFHNTKLPNFAIIHEKPEHRLIVYLKAQGLTNREVAKRTGYTEPWISQVVRQPWFQLRLLEIIKEVGGDKVEGYLSAQLEPSLLRLAHLRDHAESETVQLGATVNFLDRFLGKPVQKIESKIEVTKREDKLRSIDEEIKELEQEEEKLKQTLGARAERGVMAPAPTTQL